MKQVHAAIFSLLLMALCGCEEQSITNQDPTTRTDRSPITAAPESDGGSPLISNGQSLPLPTITKQTFTPAYSLFADTKCHTWRITWPTYPAGTDPTKIPTVFSVLTGGLNSFSFLNNTLASNTYKSTFNLYNNDKLETANTLWSELKYAYEAGEKMTQVWFSKKAYSVKEIEYMVKERPQLFEIYWQNPTDLYTEFSCKQGETYLFNLKLDQQQRYGGIRIVSMTPRIIEIYLSEPTN